MQKLQFPLLAIALALFAAPTASVRAAVIFDPIAATDTNHYPFGATAPASNTVNGSGLDPSTVSLVNNLQPVPASYPTNDVEGGATFFNNYAALPGGPTPVVTYTLAQLTDPGVTLTGGHFWQYSGDVPARSLGSASISVSSDGTSWTPAGTLTGYAEPGVGTQDAGINFSLSGTFTNVRFVELTNLVSTGGGDSNISVGFSEIRFVGSTVPEPGTLTLAALGLVGLAGVAYRRRSH